MKLIQKYPSVTKHILTVIRQMINNKKLDYLYGNFNGIEDDRVFRLFRAEVLTILKRRTELEWREWRLIHNIDAFELIQTCIQHAGEYYTITLLAITEEYTVYTFISLVNNEIAEAVRHVKSITELETTVALLYDIYITNNPYANSNSKSD